MSNTGNSLAIIERNLEPMRSRIDALVTPVGLDTRRFMQSILIACERQPRLLDFHVQQHLMVASTASTLGLEPDGVTGQLYLLPFGGKNPVIQPVIGYRGMNTMAARAGIVIHGDVLREGDRFSLELVAGRPYSVDTSGTFGNRARADIIGAWAQAQMPDGSFSSPVVMDMSEINQVRAKSAGAKRSDSPWNDTNGPGLAAMCSKTPKRRLQRVLPMILTRGLERMNISQHTLGAEMDMQHEEAGQHSWIADDHHVHTEPLEGEVVDSSPWQIAQPGGGLHDASDRETWLQRWHRGLARCERASQIDGSLQRNRAQFGALREVDAEAVMEIVEAAERRKRELEEGAE